LIHFWSRNLVGVGDMCKKNGVVQNLSSPAGPLQKYACVVADTLLDS
jgi:hypothetical protein